MKDSSNKPAKRKPRKKKTSLLKSFNLLEWFNDHFYKLVIGKSVHFLVSVTTHLGASAKPFLEKWRGDIGNREAERRISEAAERGSRLHYAFSILPTGGCVVYNPPFNKRQNYTAAQINKLKRKYKEQFIEMTSQEEQVQVWRFQQWYNIVKPKYLHTELMVYSLKHRAAGTADAVVYIKEGKYNIAGAEPLYLPEGYYILDYKTGAVVDDEFEMQVGAYHEFFKDMEPDLIPKMKGALIIHTNAKTKKGIEGLTTYFVPSADIVKKHFPDYLHTKALWERKNPNPTPKLFEFPSMIMLQQEAKKKRKKAA